MEPLKKAGVGMIIGGVVTTGIGITLAAVNQFSPDKPAGTLTEIGMYSSWGGGLVTGGGIGFVKPSFTGLGLGLVYTSATFVAPAVFSFERAGAAKRFLADPKGVDANRQFIESQAQADEVRGIVCLVFGGVWAAMGIGFIAYDLTRGDSSAHSSSSVSKIQAQVTPLEKGAALTVSGSF